MRIVDSVLNGVRLLEPTVHRDHRGFFMESYKANELCDLGIEFTFVQDNHSLSVEPGTLRGLHYQLSPKAQTKLVRVISGAIYDVVVDIRRESSTFGQWAGFNLSAENKRQLLVPVGFAHGFCTLVRDTQIMYKVDQYYSPQHDRGILWSDPKLDITWPTSNPILSEKDKNLPVFKEADINF